MADLSPERRAQLDDAFMRVGYLEYVTPGEDPEWAVLLNDALLALAPLIAGWLAAEREAGAAEVRARVQAVIEERGYAYRDAPRAAPIIRAFTDELRAALNGGE